jgi:MerR family transcriptional regulator, copper efflux regulator
MHIRELARAAGLTVDTIRFYERRGLLNGEHFSRQTNGYRYYSQEALQRLQIIGQAKASGFTLSQIEKLVKGWERDTLSTEEKVAVLQGKIADIRQRITELQKMECYLVEKLARMEHEHSRL